MPSSPRVRFAPSPTGMIHLGNVRVALFNYLFARQKDGTFILRIEDTDRARNVPGADQKIIDDLSWLSLHYDEGPIKGGDFGPYLQSERGKIYQEKLTELIENQKAYRCFCVAKELEKKRKRQMALKKPPRYDRTCLNLSADMIKAKVAEGIPFIWRFELNHRSVVEFEDMARGKMTFGLDHFSDPPLTRSDGSATFMFANFVDDWLMKISHILRGEDHLSNSAVQAAMFQEFAVPIPIFWHLPFLCNREGKKLSKRDFGFSLDDLRGAGFLPEAIVNYLAITGGSFTEEVQSLDELIENYNFEKIHTAGAIRYDVDKLRWLNHAWISRISTVDLAGRLRPILEVQFPDVASLPEENLVFLVGKVQPELRVLLDAPSALCFAFEEPTVDVAAIVDKVGSDKAGIIKELIVKHIDQTGKEDFFLDAIKHDGKDREVKVGELFAVIRYLLTGAFNGIGMHDLFSMLDDATIKRRLGAVEGL